MFLVYGGKDELDVSFQTHRDDCRSHLIFVFLINIEIVTWRSLMQETVVDSTIELKYITLSEVVKEEMWLKKFINELGVVPFIFDLIEIFYNNKGAIFLTKEPQEHKQDIYFESYTTSESSWRMKTN